MAEARIAGIGNLRGRPVKATGSGGTAEYVLDNQVGYLLRLASQRHLAIFHRRMQLELTPTQFSALIRLSEVGECSQNDLGRRAHMDVATIKGVVDRLEAKGLVASADNPADRRQRVISLTELGIAELDRLMHIGHEITAETLEPLPAEDRQKLLTLLSRLL